MLQTYAVASEKATHAARYTSSALCKFARLPRRNLNTGPSRRKYPEALSATLADSQNAGAYRETGPANGWESQEIKTRHYGRGARRVPLALHADAIAEVR
jgi:hypothetical protein